jgi:hypothetical protein
MVKIMSLLEEQQENNAKRPYPQREDKKRWRIEKNISN